MLKTIVTAAFAAALLTVPAAPGYAQADQKPEKKVSAQQQKMRDCASKWGEHKKTNDVKGRAEYNKFMSDCLKG